MGNSLKICSNCGDNAQDPFQYMEREDLTRGSPTEQQRRNRKKVDITGEAWKSAVRDMRGAMKAKEEESDKEQRSPSRNRKSDKRLPNEMRMHL